MAKTELLTVTEAAAKSGLAVTTLRTAIARNTIASTRLYGRILISTADLDAYIKRTRPDGIKRSRQSGRPPKVDDVC
jgi:excisionase family DNA binding protein